jgi:glyoxylase-like metal-dependent hydrolase (beta-lactamase superfamily II)
VLLRMSDPKTTPAIPTAAWPTSTFTGKDKKLFFNGEGVHIIHEPAAHTDGDSIVFFRRSDVISAGDIFNTIAYPIIDVANGGTINGIIAGVNHLIELIIRCTARKAARW